MDNPVEIKKLYNQRLTEANILLGNKMFDGAFYLAGYCVEFALKAKICERYGLPTLFKETLPLKKGDPQPPSKTDEQIAIDKAVSYIKTNLRVHDLYALLIYSGLLKQFMEELQKDPEFILLQSILFNLWNEQARYKTCGTFEEKSVDKLVTLLPKLLSWIERN